MKCVHGGSEAVYGLGMIGAAVYFLSHASSLGAVLLGLFKALVWPAFLVFQAFTWLNK